jgi:UDP-glucose 4-epimerase
MIVAVTGSSGFIGKKLVENLERDGHEVIKIDIAEGFDILNWDELKNIKQFDVLVHLAALSFVPLSYEEPRDFYHLNLLGLVNCLELCRQNNAKIVFSSSYVYGKPETTPINEKHPLQGFNPYAGTKIIGEKICEDYNKYFNIKTIILRPFNIYGHGQNENFLMPLILNQAKTGRIELLDPRPKRDFVYIDDVVDAFEKAVENDTIDFESFNIGTGLSYSVEEVTQMVNSLYNNKLKIIFTKAKRKNEVLDTVADISKAKRLLNWYPKISLKEGLKKMIK